MFHPDLGHQAVINGGSSSMLQYGHDSRFSTESGLPNYAHYQNNYPPSIPPHPPPNPYSQPPQPYPQHITNSYTHPLQTHYYLTLPSTPSAPYQPLPPPFIPPKPPPSHSNLSPFTEALKRVLPQVPSYLTEPPDPTLPPELESALDQKLEEFSSSFKENLKVAMEDIFQRISTVSLQQQIQPPD